MLVRELEVGEPFWADAWNPAVRNTEEKVATAHVDPWGTVCF
jgi:hypothetical protein